MKLILPGVKYNKWIGAGKIISNYLYKNIKSNKEYIWTFKGINSSKTATVFSLNNFNYSPKFKNFYSLLSKGLKNKQI